MLLANLRTCLHALSAIIRFRTSDIRSTMARMRILTANEQLPEQLRTVDKAAADNG